MTERLDWRLSREAARVALLVSWPFTAAGSLLFLPMSEGPTPNAGEAYGMIDGIYFYGGYPLTHIAFIFRPGGELMSGDWWWAMPLLNLLFFAQWMIWTQSVALGGRVLERLGMWLDDKFPLE